MKNKNSLISIDCGGEFVYQGLNSHIAKKYKADTPFDKSFVPYLIMIFCAVVDASVFLGLFKMISYDSPFMLGVQVSGCLFAYDVVPLYGGIQLRRIRQGISKDKFIVWLALGVFILAFAMNVALRLMTMELLSPDLSSVTTSYLGTVTQESSTAGNNATAVALTIFGIILPVLTSVGSFFISFLTYNPLKVRQRRDEELLGEKKDEVRRLEAILSEYDADTAYAEHLLQDDVGKFNEMKKLQRAMALSYCSYVRERLMEQLANPTSINAIAEESCVGILERLDRELVALEEEETQTHIATDFKAIKLPFNNETA